MDFDYITSWFTSYLSTNPSKETGRLKVYSQQTSFEDNEQFRYFDRLDNIPASSQIVYKITLTRPINLFTRKLSLIAGGREYLVYPDNESVTFTGTLENSGTITPMNQNLNQYITETPPSGVVIQRAVGAGIFSSTDKPVDGLLALTDGNSNRSSNELDVEGGKIGYAVGDAWVVMNHVGSNNATIGQYKLEWEAR
jgi:hypothetical protein